MDFLLPHDQEFMAEIPFPDFVLGGLPGTRLLDFAEPRATHIYGHGAVIATVTPKVLLDIYGQAKVKMPPSVETKKAYLNVDIGLKSSVDFNTGSMVIKASPGPYSFVLGPACHLSGGFALATWWDPSKAAGDWVFTVGGYHPQFNVPQHCPKISEPQAVAGSHG
ncbi:hypothetical protein FPCIR_11271 [Fusarium pseudocircinatum]|uniref:DUF6603 domain-containing protein n=1 Tax=Fusarium pseudocircinatum TaxID=56676 RepID=A0A8H5KUX7_9HYPO|nr:hypothetical protein FPCIR_11271 [Fusarium pseudocircinatum]